MIHEETGMGRYEDKIAKNLAVIDKTPGVECLVTDAISGDSGLMIEEQAPFGVIGATHHLQTRQKLSSTIRLV